MSRRFCVLFVVFLNVLSTAPALAHRSLTAEFDPSKEFAATGVLTHVDWTNPHVYRYVDAKDESGNLVTFSFEGFPPGMLHRAGVIKSMLVVEEIVTTTAIVAKDGTKHLGFGKTIKYSDGHEVMI